MPDPDSCVDDQCILFLSPPYPDPVAPGTGGLLPHGKWSLNIRENMSEVSNYRPISFPSVTTKVLDTILSTQVPEYLEEHRLLSDRQLWFRKDRSASDLLLSLSNT